MNSYISSFKKNIRKLPKSFTIFFIIFIIVEIIIHILMIDYVENYANARVRTKIKVSQTPDQNYDILIFGDSAADSGINANELKEKTGFETFNFSMGGDALMTGNYYLFEDYLLYNDIPKYIILMNVYDTWYRDLSTMYVVQALMNNFPGKAFRDFMSNPITYNPKKHILNNFAHYLIPSQRYKWEIRHIIESRDIIDFFKKRKTKESELLNDVISNNGSFEYSGQDMDSIMYDINFHKNFIETNEFEVSWYNQYYLDKFLMLAKENNIIVFFAFTPAAKEFYDENINSDYIKSYKEFIKNIPEKYDNFVLLTDDFYVVGIDKLTNSIDHLKYEDSKVFTDLIAENINKYIEVNLAYKR
jgi:hypothetical protein